MHIYKIQMRTASPRDRRPYPYYVEESGDVRRQDVWRGDPAQVIGFQRSLTSYRVDLTWKDALRSPEKATGMYLVTVDADGDFSTHSTHAVESLEPSGEAKE